MTYQRHYFADRPHSSAALALVEFSCCRLLERAPLFRLRAEYTKLIELRPAAGQLLDTFPKQCRYKIQRAEREGVACTDDVDFSDYFEFHRKFCQSKNRPAPARDFFLAHREHLLISKAMRGADTLCMHAHLIDSQASRGRLFTSSSLFRQQNDNAMRAMIGRANRLLHYWDMQQMAALALRTYDFGGYAPQSGDPAQVGLNEFKDSFGGILAQESTFVSLPLEMSRRLLSLSRRVRTRAIHGDKAGVEVQPK